MHLRQVCSIWVPIWLRLGAEIVRVMMIVKYWQLERMTPPNLEEVELSEKALARVTHCLSCTSTRIKTRYICKITIRVANTSIRWWFDKRQLLPLRTITLPLRWFEKKISTAWSIETAWQTQICPSIPSQISVALMAQLISSFRMSCRCTTLNLERRNASKEKPLPRGSYFICVSSPLHSSKRAKLSQ